MTTASQNDSWLRLIVVILAIILLAPMLMMVFAFPIMGGWMMGPGYGGQISVWGWGMMLVPLLFVLGFGYVLYRALTGENSGNDAALEELRMAYARGDISEEEFESRREQLQSER
ncbi:SHOCT domain-containing protein [Halomicrococcus sp. NG-SE-24]|uniref:SHOCT domain-containing protein n=1 Tax=Halomicrococcus sp. NG-SE-24 TaxID=3436928 RepID=UPI003D98D5B8